MSTEMVSPAQKPRMMHAIKLITANHFDVYLQEMVGEARNRNICLARHVAIYFCRKRTGASLPMIARYFGDRDHTTIMHAVNRVDQLRRAKPHLTSLHAIMDKIEEKIAEYENSDVDWIDPSLGMMDVTPAPTVAVDQSAVIGIDRADPSTERTVKAIVHVKIPLPERFNPAAVIAAAETVVRQAHDYRNAMMTTRERRARDEFLDAVARLRKVKNLYKSENENV